MFTSMSGNKDGYNVLIPNFFITSLTQFGKNIPIGSCVAAGPLSEGEWSKMIECLQDGLFDQTPINSVAAYCAITLFVKPPYVMIEKTRICQELGVKPQMLFTVTAT